MSHLPHVSIITRLRLDACLYDPAPMREAGKRGRRALKGKAQPKLSQRLTDPATQWEKHPLSWYGGTTREMEIATGTALWYQSPVPPVAIRWVLIRDPKGQYEPMALLCTDQDVDAAQMVEWFVWRWTVEVTFHEVRDHLGVETQRQWADLAILRTTPALLGLFSLVTIFAFCGRHRANSTSPFRALRGDARFCCLISTIRLKNLDKVYQRSHQSLNTMKALQPGLLLRQSDRSG